MKSRFLSFKVLIIGFCPGTAIASHNTPFAGFVIGC